MRRKNYNINQYIKQYRKYHGDWGIPEKGCSHFLYYWSRLSYEEKVVTAMKCGKRGRGLQNWLDT